MRLTDLEPRWVGKESIRYGLTFLCPHCRNIRLGVPFEPGWKGDPPIPVLMTWEYAALTMRMNSHTWHRVGDCFETISLSPSIDVSGTGHWHGWITNGEVT